MNSKFSIIFIAFLIVISANCLGIEEEVKTINNLDEIVVLKKLFNNLKELKNSIDILNSRYEEYKEIKDILSKDSSIFDIRFDAIPPKCKTDKPPRNCAEATSCIHRSGIYKILIEKYSNDTFLVECDVKTEDGGWLLVQRREDGSVDFNRNWTEYQTGFGRIDGEFFIGLDKLYALTNFNGPQELLIILEDKNEVKRAKYSNFVIGNETDFYTLQHLGVYKGDAGDSLIYHLGSKFSTKDKDNDKHDTTNCAQRFAGAWWHNSCHNSNLNGKYGDKTMGKGIIWSTFRSYNTSLEHVKMMIRRRTF
ncbi:angiopoietin-related protein 1-like [Cochliomyia hominivorax]